MRGQIKKWGNSAAVRIPAAILSAARLRIDQDIEIREEEGRIVIQAAVGLHYDLDALLGRMTPENMPGSVNFGARAGREIS